MDRFAPVLQIAIGSAPTAQAGSDHRRPRSEA